MFFACKSGVSRGEFLKFQADAAVLQITLNNNDFSRDVRTHPAKVLLTSPLLK